MTASIHTRSAVARYALAALVLAALLLGAIPAGAAPDPAPSPPESTAGAEDWSIVPSPNVGGAQTNNSLRDTTCVSASDCWAVGQYGLPGEPDVTKTLIEHWDGTSWAIVASPNTSTTDDNVLDAVTCVSTSDCWAVGRYGNNGAGGAGLVVETLIQRWDGTSWTIVTPPNAIAMRHPQLNDVTCVSASDCWAVGIYQSETSSVARTLIEHWDGTSWAIVGARWSLKAGAGAGTPNPQGERPEHPRLLLLAEKDLPRDRGDRQSFFRGGSAEAASQGLTDTAAMARLGWSRRTFERRLKVVMSKPGARSRFQAGFRVGSVGWIKDR